MAVGVNTEDEKLFPETKFQLKAGVDENEVAPVALKYTLLPLQTATLNDDTEMLGVGVTLIVMAKLEVLTHIPVLLETV